MLNYRFDNMDAVESVYFNRQLEAIRAGSYDIKYEELKARNLVPVDNSLGNHVDTVTYRQYDRVGVAKFISNYADDLPRADVLGKEFKSSVRSMGSSYGYNLQEIRTSRAAGAGLDQKRANAARRAIEELIEATAKTGHSPTGLLGLLNQPNAQVFTVPADGTGSSALFVNKTPDQVVRDLCAIQFKVVETTKEQEIPTTLLLPLSVFHSISVRRMGDGSDETILSYFLKISPYVKEVVPWSGLETAGSGGTKRMVCYKKSPDALQLIIPQEFEQLPPETRGMEYVTNCHARCGGVVMYYPLSMAYGDGI
jgi:hypothetical protein